MLHYNLRQIPQTYQWNPALFPQYKFYWGTTFVPFAIAPIPFANSLYINKGTAGPGLKDFIIHKGDSVQINTDVISKAKKYNYSHYNIEIGLLSFGFRLKGINYINFYSSLKNHFWLGYPGDAIKLLIEGNGGGNVGKNFDLGLKINHNTYLETGINFAREIKQDKLFVGGTLKMYNGIANFQTKTNKTTFLTGDTAFEYIAQSDVLINVASVYDTNTYQVKYGQAFKNLGFGIDLGANYIINDKFSINAAVLDIGYIKYKTFAQNYAFKGNLYFPGIDLKKVINDSMQIDQALQKLADSLAKKYHFTQTNNAYTVWMPSKINIQAIHHINDKHSLSGILQTVFYDKKPHLAGSVGYIFRPNRWFNTSIAYQIYNRYYANLGLGFAFNLGFMQWYVMTDNLFGFTNWANFKYTERDSNGNVKNTTSILFPTSRNINIRTGCNWTFGAKPKDRDKDGIPDRKDICPDNYGLAIYQGCPDSDADSIPDKDDKCPYISGLKPLQGCPDKDNDGITDAEDNCPDEAGSMEFKGCPDKDGDKIIDKEDECPDEPGLAEFKGCPDKDGDKIMDKQDDCPDEAGLAEFKGCPDKDADGIPDKEDKCPEIAGPKEYNGCPDKDKDGIIDINDNCPDEPGVAENKGCPWPDTDKDGIIDKDDACPTQPGIPELKGCPPAPKLTAKEEKIIQKAFSNLEFETGKDIIRPKSFPALNELADLLKQHPDWILTLSGHTDNQGTPESNMILSEKRAKAVAKYLIKKGVKPENIITEWFGDTKPIADNNTPQGRQKNRRVEMKVTYKEKQ
ncbi:MAG: OmpA family protein [Bacteroidetes bacterium]|nr:MAG: OmpA family protein [Bacteroidota bacterium]